MGLYRNDAQLGAVFAFNLDPVRSSWDVHRIAVVGDATWTFQPLGWHRPGDIAIHLRRKLRQYQGRFENLAYQDHCAFRRRPIAELPQTSAAMVFGWIYSNTRKAILEVLRHPLAVHALYRLWRAPELSGLNSPPRLLWESASEGMHQVAKQQVSLS